METKEGTLLEHDVRHEIGIEEKERQSELSGRFLREESELIKATRALSVRLSGTLNSGHLPESTRFSTA